MYKKSVGVSHASRDSFFSNLLYFSEKSAEKEPQHVHKTDSIVVENEVKTSERPVEVGIRAEGGLVEIISGLVEGESVSLSR